ncbi:MAG: MFS transporter [Syntrophomonadaceae bacterium]|nr:MFS transporter [Syntrophomonadaceae bacterium]
MNKPDQKQERVTLFTVMCSAFLVPFIASALNLALPTMGHEFNSSAVLLSWVLTSYLVASAAFLLPFGRLADIKGRHSIFQVGLGLFSLFTLLSALSPNIEIILIFRVLQGVAAAMIFSTSTAILTDVFPVNRRGRVLGLSVSSTYVGLSLGPVLGGWMNFYMGWRSIFYFIAAISLVVTIFAVLYMKGEWKEAAGESFDWQGSLLYLTSLGAFMYGISALADTSTAKYFASTGALLLLSFIRYELRQDQPLIDMQLFVKNISFAFSNLAAMINYSATFALSFLMSLYLQTVLGFSSQHAGMVMLAQPLMMALFSPLAGNLSDRVEPRIVASTGMGLTALGLFGFIFLGLNTPIIWIIADLLLIGLGFALFSSPNTNAVMASVQPRLYGIASSTLGTMRMIGQAFSMAIVTMILAVYIGNQMLAQVDPQVLMNSMKTTFIIFTILCFLGIFASVARGNTHSERKSGVNE